MRLIVTNQFPGITFLPDIDGHGTGTAHRSYGTHNAAARPKPAIRVIVRDGEFLVGRRRDKTQPGNGSGLGILVVRLATRDEHC